MPGAEVIIDFQPKFKPEAKTIKLLHRCTVTPLHDRNLKLLTKERIAPTKYGCPQQCPIQT